MNIDIDALLVRARVLLKAKPKCWIEQELAEENEYCTKAFNRIPGRLNGPGFPLKLSIDHPLYNAANLWNKQLIDNRTHIIVLGEISSDYYASFRSKLDYYSEIACFNCQVLDLKVCECKRCKLCGRKECNMNCYVDE